MTPDAVDKRLLAAIADGLPLTPRPYADVAAELGLGKEDVLDRLQRMLDSGIINRFGIIVRHRELGYRANAMAVWDISDDAVNEVAGKIRDFPFVTLCYQRPRRLPEWPYNLFCMIHGRDRPTVLGQIDRINLTCELMALPRDVLFSRRRFKQCGAHYGPVAGVRETVQEVA